MFSSRDLVVVTAQKRTQQIDDVPLSLDVISGAKLDALSAGGEDILFLAARSPSLYAESSSGRNFPRFYIRGLGNTDFDLNANQPVSLVYDEIVLENSILKGFPVFDLDRVEILRGPQGTLFGRNTPAGVIKFESAKPTDEFEGYGRVSYGRFNAVDAEGAISGPVAGDTLAGRLSLFVQRRDDFVDNTFDFGGEEGFEEFFEFAGRAQLLFKPNDRVSSLLNIHGRRLDGGSRLFRANVIRPGLGGLVDGFRHDETAQDATQILEVYNVGASLKTDVDLGFGVLTSVTGYEQVGITARGDVDGGFGADFAPPSGPGFIPFAAESADNITGHDQVTQELRLNFNPSRSVNATVGGFFFYENLELENLSFDTLAAGAENGRAIQDQDTYAWAVFGSAEWAATDRLTLQGGLRVSGEDKRFIAERLVGPFGAGTVGPVRRDLDGVVFSGDFSATYALTPKTNVYARYARGFRAPNVQGRIVFGDAVTVADTETTDSVEAGLKSAFWDGRGRVSLAGFWYRTNNQQLTAVGGAGNFNQLLNADSVIGYGFEAEAALSPVEGLDLTAGLSLNETEIDDVGLEVGVCGAPCTILDPINPLTGNALIDGNPLPQAPRWIANATMRYGVQVFGGRGEAFILTDWAYRSRIGFFLYESVEFQDRDLLEGGVRIGYARGDGRYEIAAFGRNITNDVSIEGAIDFNNFSAFVNEPPTWGVELLARL
ncbi:MAG: TonB-dependent receptor [Amphiplicatus sp.]